MRLRDFKKAIIILYKLPRYVKLTWGLSKDKRVPLYLKTLAFSSIAYLFVPLDIIPDVLPAKGLIDDLIVLLLIFERFVAFCPKEVVEEHLQKVEMKISDFDEDLKTVSEFAKNTYSKIKNYIEEIIKKA